MMEKLIHKGMEAESHWLISDYRGEEKAVLVQKEGIE